MEEEAFVTTVEKNVLVIRNKLTEYSGQKSTYDRLSGENWNGKVTYYIMTTYIN